MSGAKDEVRKGSGPSRCSGAGAAPSTACRPVGAHFAASCSWESRYFRQPTDCAPQPRRNVSAARCACHAQMFLAYACAQRARHRVISVLKSSCERRKHRRSPDGGPYLGPSAVADGAERSARDSLKLWLRSCFNGREIASGLLHSCIPASYLSYTLPIKV